MQIVASSLDELVSALDTSWPGMRDRLLEAGPRFREHINVFVDGERVRDRGTLGDPVGPQARVVILQALSGG